MANGSGKISDGAMRHQVRGKGTLKGQKVQNISALMVAKIVRVDPVRMVVDLATLTGNLDSYEAVPLGFGGAGNRHFIGAIPHCGDLCVIGFAPAESGHTGRPYILSWLVPGVTEGYDWMATQPMPPTAQGMSAKVKEALKGAANRVRHKLRLLEEGDVFVSSGQGADLLLTESALLTNRRGNEVLLRDQDQAIVMRSLQQFHAGAGFRVYAGMVQRDAALPTQMFAEDSDWAATRQVDGETQYPLSPWELGPSAQGAGYLNPAEVFSRVANSSGVIPIGALSGFGGFIDPVTNAKRGRYLNPSLTIGALGSLVQDDPVYGGKKFFRLATTGGNSVDASDADSFTEYRIEVAHTSDGTLPVTEQTDGFDVDRLPPNAPIGDVSDPSNKSSQAMMAELVLGTVVGNDPFGDLSGYRKPLKAITLQADGSPVGALVVADPTEIEEHLAFLVRVVNPVNPKAPAAFMGITKGGAWKQFFPGSGSSGSEMVAQSGHKISVGQDAAGVGFGVTSAGMLNLVNTGTGAPSNVGVNIASQSGAVVISAAGATTEGASLGSGTDQGDKSPSGQQVALSLLSEKSSLWKSALTAMIKAQTFTVDDNDTTSFNTNTQFSVQSGGGVGLEGKTVDIQSNGKFTIACGGPKDGLLTNGGAFELSTMANPATGFPGGAVASFTSLFGNLINTITTSGQYVAKSQVGGCSLGSFGTPDIVPVIPLPGVSCSFGPAPGVGASNMVGPAGAVSTAFQGVASMSALAGAASITATLAATVTSSAMVSITGPRVSVYCAGLPGAVLTDACIDSFTGMPFLLGGTVGTPGFRVNS